ncbi:heterokaryon incompatibility protein-domain-containing protein, partial [Phaeosphaeria sp. MPI-PUGE-AT-0046c]
EYQYEKIQYDVIRVVVLLPGFEADPIRCQVRTVPRKRSTPYTAVSYTWATEKGDATKSQCIYIHSEENLNTWAFISVTVNCENALRQLRDVLTHNVVWVDSVCVNQKDVAEVNDQVSAMVETYICATNTAICLNTPGKDFVEAIKLFISEPDIAKQTERSGQLDLACRPALVQLAHLFELRYFQRVWVVQEVVLADKVLLYIDGAVVPFEKRTLRYMNALCSRAQISIPLLSHWSSVYTGVTKDGGLDMVSILKMSMQCSASDPRDRVFATTGFLRSSVRAVIPVDYSLSLEHVLAYAASACIRCRGDLEILRYAKLPLNASVVAASSFGIEQFEDFIARTKPREGH